MSLSAPDFVHNTTITFANGDNNDDNLTDLSY